MTTAIHAAMPHFWGYAPTEETGPRALPVSISFEFGNAPTHIVDLSQEQANAVLPFVQGVWIDNAENPNVLSLVTDVIGQRILFPAFSQGIMPLFVSNPPKFYVSSTAPVDAMSNYNVKLIFLNVPLGQFNYPAV